MEEKKYKKGDNPKGQGPCKPKKQKTKEEKEAQRAKQAEKKRLKKEQARLEEEAKKKKELEASQNLPNDEKEDEKKEEDKKEEEKKEDKKEEAIDQKEKKGKNEEEKKEEGKKEEDKIEDKKAKKEKEGKKKDKKENKKKDKNEEDKKKENKEEDKKEGNKEEDKKEEKKKEEDKKENDKKEVDKKEGKKGKKEKKGKKGEKENENQDKEDNSQKQQKDNKKKKIQFYGITSFEERNEELKLAVDKKEENENPILSTREIIEFLSKDVKYSKINEEIINSIRAIFLCGTTKQTKNCVNLLNAIKLFVDLVEGDDIFKLCDEVSSLIRKVNKLIEDISEKCSGLFNTCKYLQKIAKNISSYPKDISKELIKLKIQYFIERRIKKIDNNNIIMKDLIQNGDTILFFGKSKIFKKLLINAKENNIKFSIIIADSPKRSQISSEIKFISKLNVPVKYTYIKGVNNIMSEVTKVFIKGDSMLINGDLMGRQGTSILALMAKIFNKSVYVFCPSFKFINKIIISNNPKIIKKKENNCNEMVFDYNVTPSNLIKTIICENGYIHASSIPVYINELENNDDLYIKS